MSTIPYYISPFFIFFFFFYYCSSGPSICLVYAETSCFTFLFFFRNNK